MIDMNAGLPENVLLIFAKWPEPGEVKTRLAKTIGHDAAASLYKTFVELLLADTRSERYGRAVFFYPAERKNEMARWLGGDVKLIPQKGVDLGERLSNAFSDAFSGGSRRAVVIGTDSPLIDRSAIENAFEKLDEGQCVIGPSKDGGYYLLGMSSYHEELFKGIEWGTDKVFAQTERAMVNAGLQYRALSASFDIDVWTDVMFLGEELGKAPLKDDGRFDLLRKQIALLENTH